MYQLESVVMQQSRIWRRADPVMVVPSSGPLGGYDVQLDGQVAGWAPDFESAMALCNMEGWL